MKRLPHWILTMLLVALTLSATALAGRMDIVPGIAHGLSVEPPPPSHVTCPKTDTPPPCKHVPGDDENTNDKKDEKAADKAAKDAEKAAKDVEKAQEEAKKAADDAKKAADKAADDAKKAADKAAKDDSKKAKKS